MAKRKRKIARKKQAPQKRKLKAALPGFVYGKKRGPKALPARKLPASAGKKSKGPEWVKRFSDLSESESEAFEEYRTKQGRKARMTKADFIDSRVVVRYVDKNNRLSKFTKSKKLRPVLYLVRPKAMGGKVSKIKRYKFKLQKRKLPLTMQKLYSFYRAKKKGAKTLLIKGRLVIRS